MLNAKCKKQKVYVAMSGGVDSSVSAALLKDGGYDVHGVHLRIQSSEWPSCTGTEDERDAQRVAVALGIPFTVIDMTQEYKERVVKYMLDEYKVGRTPNPDVMCNKEIKFGLFYDWVMKEGGEFMATGHYSRTMCDKTQNTKHKNPNTNKASSCKLLMAIDTNKDQTYFLWTLTQEKLRHTLFPIGDLQKNEVREIAKKYKLPVAEKKDSQGLCFVGHLDVKDFLKKHLTTTQGDVLDMEGNVIGKHEGAILYTLGERHGFSVLATSSTQKPLFVIAKDIQNNTITVSEEKLDEAKNEVTISNCNWIGEAPTEGKRYLARVRYRQPLQNCVFEESDGSNAVVLFDNPQIATSGQSLVLYEGEICIGGAIID